MGADGSEPNLRMQLHASFNGAAPGWARMAGIEGEIIAVVTASMGPRLDGRGWLPPRLPSGHMVALQWGRAWMGADGPYLKALGQTGNKLQWGRAWMGADGPHPDSSRRRPGCFNGAAPGWARMASGA